MKPGTLKQKGPLLASPCLLLLQLIWSLGISTPEWQCPVVSQVDGIIHYVLRWPISNEIRAKVLMVGEFKGLDLE